jgi:hypothetical protein
MGSALFKSRRSPAPAQDTAKVADAVRAYYEAGRRPSAYRFDVPEPPAVDEQHDEPQSEGHDAESQASDSVREPPVTSDGQSLAELADELEALIESIRYGSVST